MFVSKRCFLILAALAAMVALAVGSSCTCTCSTYARDLPGDCSTCNARCTTYCNGTWVAYTCVSSACFPSHATVELESRSVKTMADLVVGDRVRVAGDQFSDIYMFSHRDPEATSTFVKLTTSANRTLMLTPDHYLYVNGKLVTAKTVQAGDAVSTGNGELVAVTAVSQEQSTGLFNPHTLHGDIIVDGIRASVYTAAVAPTLAHALLWPVRMFYQMGIDVTSDTFASGSDLLAAITPRGRDGF